MLEPRIKDLLRDVESLSWVSPHATVAQAVGALGAQAGRGGPALVLVGDKDKDKGEILGTISPSDILKRIEPPACLDNEIPIFWQGQFLEEAAELLARPAAEVMSPIEHVLNQNCTLMEALHLMNSGQIELAIAVQGEDVAGIIFRRDLFAELAAITQAGADQAAG